MGDEDRRLTGSGQCGTSGDRFPHVIRKQPQGNVASRARAKAALKCRTRRLQRMSISHELKCDFVKLPVELN
jgi:hypothetical protein